MKSHSFLCRVYDPATRTNIDDFALIEAETKEKAQAIAEGDFEKRFGRKPAYQRFDWIRTKDIKEPVTAVAA
ncbi:hypothetical protein GCM10027347_52920 [Larkinella harenae]